MHALRQTGAALLPIVKLNVISFPQLGHTATVQCLIHMTVQAIVVGCYITEIHRTGLLTLNGLIDILFDQMDLHILWN